MVKIVSVTTGDVIGVTETPRYIRTNDNGINVETSKETAEGVAYNSVAYNLSHVPDADVAEAEDTVVLVEFDGGELFSQNREAMNEMTAKLDYLSMMTDTPFPGPTETPQTEMEGSDNG